jgi:hypothetical protein
MMMALVLRRRRRPGMIRARSERNIGIGGICAGARSRRTHLSDAAAAADEPSAPDAESVAEALFESAFVDPAFTAATTLTRRRSSPRRQ